MKPTIKMRVVKRLPGHGSNFDIGDIVEAVPASFIPKCFNVTKRGRVNLYVTSVPAEHLEEVK